MVYPQLEAYTLGSGSKHWKKKCNINSDILSLLKIREHCRNGIFSAFRLSHHLLPVLFGFVWLIYQKYKNVSSRYLLRVLASIAPYHLVSSKQVCVLE